MRKTKRKTNWKKNPIRMRRFSLIVYTLVIILFPQKCLYGCCERWCNILYCVYFLYLVVRGSLNTWEGNSKRYVIILPSIHVLSDTTYAENTIWLFVENLQSGGVENSNFNSSWCRCRICTVEMRESQSFEWNWGKIIIAHAQYNQPPESTHNNN